MTISEIRNEISQFEVLNQTQIDKLYLQEEIRKYDEKKIKRQLKILRDKLEKLEYDRMQNKLLEGIGMSEKGTHDKKVQEIESKIAELEELSESKKDVSNILYGNTRKFPTKETRNKVFYGNVHLAFKLALKYYYKDECNMKFDDVFQLACEALLSACHYYMPSGQAKFTTYAYRCIENRLKREIFKSRKRKIKSKDFFKKELDRMNFIRMFLESATHSSKRHFTLKNISLSKFLNRLNKEVSRYNETLTYIGERGRALPSTLNKTIRKDMYGEYDKLINMFRMFIKEGKLNVLIDDIDKSNFELLADYLKVEKEAKPYFLLANYVYTYIQKIIDIEFYSKIVGELTKENNGVLPSNDEILKAMNKELSSLHKVRKTFFKSVRTYNEEYESQFDVNFLKNFEDFSDMDGISKKEEKEQILEEYEDIYCNVYYNDHTLEEIIDYYEYHLEELEEKMKEDPNAIVTYDIASFVDSNNNELFEYVIDINLYEEDDDINSCNIKDFIELLQKQLKIIREHEIEEEDYLKQELKRRKKSVNAVLKEVNAPIYEHNREIAYVKKYGERKRKYTKKDIERIEDNISLLYSNDDELMVLMNGNRGRSKNINLSVEDEVCGNIFLETYYDALEELPLLQKQILLRWFDENGIHDTTAKEIAKELGITPSKVYKEKTKALNMLSTNPKIRSYKE